MKKNKITGAYVRISTDKKQKIDSQVDDIKEYCNNHGIDAEYYVDEGFTGNNTDRPEFNRLQEDVFKGRVNRIIVSRVNRISRRASEGIRIFDEWLEKDIEIISVKESLNFSGPTGKLTRRLLQILSEWDQEVRREAALKGIKVSREKNPEKYSGRKVGAYSVETAKIMKLKGSGYTLDEISETLKIAKSTVQNHISRKVCEDVAHALSRVAEKNNLDGRWTLNYDFKKGLNGKFVSLDLLTGEKSTLPTELPPLDDNYKSPFVKSLDPMMRYAKKWYPSGKVIDEVKAYEEALFKLAEIWYKYHKTNGEPRKGDHGDIDKGNREVNKWFKQRTREIEYDSRN